MPQSAPRVVSPSLPTGVLAGIAGGSAEVVWIVLYDGLTGGSAAAVARGVTASVFPSLGTAWFAVATGIAIHMALAVILGIAVVAALRAAAPYLSGRVSSSTAVLAALFAVWAANFLIVLPVVSPPFVDVVPYEASLASKLLFGLAAAAVLKLRTRAPARR